MDSEYPIKPLDFAGISTYPLASRSSKVHSEMFGKPMDGSENVLALISKLPHILAGDSLRTLIRAILYARSLEKPIVWGLGGHVIKVGLGPVINDLIRSGFVTGIAMNGAAAIHDFEVGEYQEAASAFRRRYKFRAFTPKTGLIANHPINIRMLKRALNANARLVPPDDVEAWIRLIHV